MGNIADHIAAALEGGTINDKLIAFFSALETGDAGDVLTKDQAGFSASPIPAQVPPVAYPRGGTLEGVFVPGFDLLGASPSTLVVTAGIHYEPWRVSRPFILHSIKCEVTVANAQAHRVGIYTANENWQPVAVFHAGPAAQSRASTTGWKEFIFDVEIPAGIYLAVLWSETNATYSFIDSVTVGRHTLPGDANTVRQFAPVAGAMPVWNGGAAGIPAVPVPWTEWSGSGSFGGFRRFLHATRG